MSNEPVPEDVRQFLSQHVKSIAELEILLLLGASPGRSWGAKEVYKVLLSNEALVERVLESYAKAGLIQKADADTYQFSSVGEAAPMVKQLGEIYRNRPGRIVQLIYEPPLSEIAEFAKAFKIRRKP